MTVWVIAVSMICLLVFILFIIDVGLPFKRSNKYDPEQPMLQIRGPDENNAWHYHINLPDYVSSCCDDFEYSACSSLRERRFALYEAKNKIDAYERSRRFANMPWEDASDEYRRLRIAELEAELGMLD
jgi:hypothetical protein